MCHARHSRDKIKEYEAAVREAVEQVRRENGVAALLDDAERTAKGAWERYPALREAAGAFGAVAAGVAFVLVQVAVA